MTTDPDDTDVRAPGRRRGAQSPTSSAGLGCKAFSGMLGSVAGLAPSTLGWRARRCWNNS